MSMLLGTNGYWVQANGISSSLLLVADGGEGAHELARHLVHGPDELRRSAPASCRAAWRAALRATAATRARRPPWRTSPAFGIAPPVMTNLSLPLAKSFSTLATATGSAADAVGERTDHLVGQPRERGIGDGPAHQGVLHHPEIDARSARLRAKLRHRCHGQAAVFDHHDGLSTGDLLRHFGDYRLLLFQIKTQVLLILTCRGTCRASATSVTIRPGDPGQGDTICAGLGD